MNRLEAQKIFLIMLSLGSFFFVAYYLAITTKAPIWTIYASVLSLTFAFWTANTETKQNTEKRIYSN